MAEPVAEPAPVEPAVPAAAPAPIAAPDVDDGPIGPQLPCPDSVYKYYRCLVKEMWANEDTKGHALRHIETAQVDYANAMAEANSAKRKRETWESVKQCISKRKIELDKEIRRIEAQF